MPTINLTQQFCTNPTPPDAGKRKIEHCDTQYPASFWRSGIPVLWALTICGTATAPIKHIFQTR